MAKETRFSPEENTIYIYIMLSSIYKGLITLVCILLLPLLLCRDVSLPWRYQRDIETMRVVANVPVLTPEPTPTPTPTPDPNEIQEADLTWWQDHPVFSNFLAFDGYAIAPERFKNGPERFSTGQYQYKLTDVSLEDYQAYITSCYDKGFSHYLEFDSEFVDGSAIEFISIEDGFTTFEAGGYKLSIYYRAYAKELIFQTE